VKRHWSCPQHGHMTTAFERITLPGPFVAPR
jgi:hypothetical protein